MSFSFFAASSSPPGNKLEYVFNVSKTFEGPNNSTSSIQNDDLKTLLEQLKQANMQFKQALRSLEQSTTIRK